MPALGDNGGGGPQITPRPAEPQETINTCQNPYDMKLYTDIRDKNVSFKDVLSGEMTSEVIDDTGSTFTVT